jgi:hypothetical protein
MGRSLFVQEALSVAPRVLGLCDRQDDAPTYGCSDRAYWRYRFMDFPNARFQEAGLLMALAATTEVEGNMFYGQAKLEAWARAAWRFWLSRRNSDGSAQEAYPNERSLCATAFSAAAFVETVRLLGGSAAWGDELAQAENTFVWLSRQAPAGVANQMAAVLWALTGFDALSGHNLKSQPRARLLGLADKEGVLPEYGGFDAGYQSISMSALARAQTWSDGDDEIDALLRQGETLLARHVDANGFSDPASNSRGTQYIYPSSLAYLKSPVLDRLIRDLEAGSLMRPSWMDDRYCISFAIDFFFAGRES